MIFDWADVAAVGLAMRDIANEDDGYTPSAKTASYTVEARYAHHVATASALREAYEAGINEATQEAYDAADKAAVKAYPEPYMKEAMARALEVTHPELGAPEWGQLVEVASDNAAVVRRVREAMRGTMGDE